jgi:hypothetical protein
MALDKMTADIEKARERYGDGQPFEEERVLDCIVFKAERTSQELYDLGKYCLWYKAEVGHGHFLEGLRQRDINISAANWAMLMVEKFGDKFCTVQNLGTRKARLLTTFTTEEIDAYAKGGPLGNIPHDEVTNKTYTELVETVKALQHKNENLKERHKKDVEKLSAEIENLRFEVAGQDIPTKEQLAVAELAKLDSDYFHELTSAMAAMRKAADILNWAQCVPGANVQMLNDWVGKYNEEMVLLNGVREEFINILDNLHPVTKGEYQAQFGDDVEVPSDVPGVC